MSKHVQGRLLQGEQLETALKLVIGCAVRDRTFPKEKSVQNFNCISLIYQSNGATKTVLVKIFKGKYKN